jgi:hypothetical protein
MFLLLVRHRSFIPLFGIVESKFGVVETARDRDSTTFLAYVHTYICMYNSTLHAPLRNLFSYLKDYIRTRKLKERSRGL